MKIYERKDFIKLPPNTIYSRDDTDKFFFGLFCKTSGNEIATDWYEQDLINEPLTPEGMTDGIDILFWTIEQKAIEPTNRLNP